MDYDDLLANYLDEHYTHARTHEALRAQIVGILTAAALVVIGWAITQSLAHTQISVVGVGVIAIGLLSWRLTYLHTNRIDAHLDAARTIRDNLDGRLTRAPGSISIADARGAFRAKKRGELSRTWYLMSVVVTCSGLAISLYGTAPTFSRRVWQYVVGVFGAQ